MLVIASVIVLEKAVRVNSFKIIKEQVSGILLIGSLFVIFGSLWVLRNSGLDGKTGEAILMVLAVIWNIAQLLVLWKFFFTNWKTAKMTFNMDKRTARTSSNISDKRNSTNLDFKNKSPILQVKVTKSKINLKYINYGAYFYVLVTSGIYVALIYTSRKTDGVVLNKETKVLLSFYFGLMVIYWVALLVMQFQSNSVLLKVTKKAVGNTSSLIAKLSIAILFTIFCVDLAYIVMFFVAQSSWKSSYRINWIFYCDTFGRTLSYCLMSYIYWITCVGKD